VTTRGRVLAFGDARSRGEIKDGKTRIVDIAPTPSGRGYWLVSAGGRVFPFGDANRYGASRGDETVVSILPTATGLGYSLVGSSGAIRAFGDAVVPAASTPKIAGEYVAAAASPLGGVWLATADGKVVPAGAPALADLSHHPAGSPVVDIAATAGGRGYYLLLANGNVKAFGDAR
jgi:hypothetical protein